MRPPPGMRKRKSPGSQFDQAESHSSNKSEKPSKRRKTYKTPPRGLGSSEDLEKGVSFSGGAAFASKRSLNERIARSYPDENRNRADGAGNVMK